jgi:hypothetical protein
LIKSEILITKFYFSAESQGVIAAGVFLVLMFIMIAIVFSEHLRPESDFPHNKVDIFRNKTNNFCFFQVCRIFSCFTFYMLYGITRFC